MINVKDLSFSYGSKGVLKNISLTLEGGNIYGLLGENGVGKTTLLTLLCGLKKPQAGTIETDGRNPFDRQPSLLAEQFYLPDEVSPMRYKALDFGRETGDLWPNFDFNKYLTILTEFEVDTTQRMDSMSAGQLKKTWIAFALACNARHYFMDEPTNGLDIPSKADFRRILTQYVGGERCVIISTHQVRDVENLIDPIVIISCNKVLLNASMQRIAEKLCFEYTLAPDPAALYSEMQPNGCLNVVPNTNGKESQVNIEALFNAVLRNSETVNRIFNSMESDEERFAPKQSEIV